jgi:hypothetical protein
MQMAGAAPGRPEEPQLFHVDHPFLFAFLDDASGAPCFRAASWTHDKCPVIDRGCAAGDC